MTGRRVAWTGDRSRPKFQKCHRTETQYKCGGNVNGEGRDERDRSFVEAVRDHALGRLSKLASVKFSEFLSYSHHEEYPSLVRSLKGWMEVLSLRAYSEISHHGHCSYQVLESMALCTGTATLVFYSLDRKLPKEMPLAAHLRSRAGRAITDCYKTSGYLVLPPHLLFGVWENCSRVGRLVGTHELLGARSSFILKDYMYLLNRRLRNADDSQLTQYRTHLFSLSRYVLLKCVCPVSCLWRVYGPCSSSHRLILLPCHLFSDVGTWLRRSCSSVDHLHCRWYCYSTCRWPFSRIS